MARVCHIYQVSPLWKFVASQTSLQTYSEQLTGLLGSVVTGQVRGRQPSYVGVVSVVKNLGSEGSRCVQVTVRGSHSAQGEVTMSQDGNHVKCFCITLTGIPECCAMICSTTQSPTVEKGTYGVSMPSWQCPHGSALMDYYTAGFTYLPWMLVCGSSSMAQVVIDWVKNSFDCCITGAKLDQDCLHSIANHYTTTQRRKHWGHTSLHTPYTDTPCTHASLH